MTRDFTFISAHEDGNIGSFVMLNFLIIITSIMLFKTKLSELSSGSSNWIRGGGEKHEIYAAVFGVHLFYDLFLQGWGRAWPLGSWFRYWN